MEQFPTEEMLALIRSPAGQQLLSMLQQHDSDALEKARQMAQSGNYSGVQQALAPLLRDPQILRLLAQLGGGTNE